MSGLSVDIGQVRPERDRSNPKSLKIGPESISCYRLLDPSRLKIGGTIVQDSGMIRLTEALNAWGTPDFKDILKKEIEQLDAEQLPLQQGLTTGSYAIDGKLDAMIIGVSEAAGWIRVKAGIFYAGIIAGCSCADDPTPVNEESEYCVVQLDIHKQTAETTIALLVE